MTKVIEFVLNRQPATSSPAGGAVLGAGLPGAPVSFLVKLEKTTQILWFCCRTLLLLVEGRGAYELFSHQPPGGQLPITIFLNVDDRWVLVCV